jgi:hypothetical protein
MQLKSAALVAACALAGFAGGLCSRYVVSDPLTSFRHTPQRATRFELVDQAGKLRAFLGFDRHQMPVFSLLDPDGAQRVVMTVFGHMPTFQLNDAEGKERFVLTLPGGEEEPLVLMRDSRKVRLSLGAVPAFPGVPGPSDSWALRFHWNGFESQDIAALAAGYGADAATSRGTLLLQGQGGKVLALPAR